MFDFGQVKMRGQLYDDDDYDDDEDERRKLRQKIIITEMIVKTRRFEEAKKLDFIAVWKSVKVAQKWSYTHVTRNSDYQMWTTSTLILLSK